MKVVAIVTRVGEEAAGPSYSVPRLCDALAARGADVLLRVLAPVPDGICAARGCRRAASGRSCRGWASRWNLSARCVPMRSARTSSIITACGCGRTCIPLRRYGARAAAWSARRAAPLVPYALARRKWLKRVLWFGGHAAVVTAAACLHATAPAEADALRRLGVRKPLAVIPNGIDLPPLPKRPTAPARARQLLYLGRIHPIKAIDRLLQAWSALHTRFPDWELCIAGPGQ